MKNRYFFVAICLIVGCVFCTKLTSNFDFSGLLSPASPPTILKPSKVGSMSVSSLLTAQPIVKKSQPTQTVHLLLQALLAKQADPEYQAALKILSNHKIRNSLHDYLVSIQYFFLDYTAQIFKKNIVQAKSKTQQNSKQPITLTEFLQQVTPTSTVQKTDVIYQLSDLTGFLQKHSTKKITLTGAQKININFDTLLSSQVTSQPVTMQNSSTTSHSSINFSGLLTSE